MKKTFSIHLGGRLFHIDEDAFQRLEAYLRELREQAGNTGESGEILNDIEMRMADLLVEMLGQVRPAVVMADVEAVIRELGEPSEMGFDAPDPGPGPRGPKKLFRDPENRLAGGVAAGIAAYFGVQAWVVRLVFILMVFGYFAGPLIYFVLWLILPEAGTGPERLQMKGEPVNIGNLWRSRGKTSPGAGTSGVWDQLAGGIGSIIRTIADSIRVILRFGWVALKKLGGLFLLLMVLGLFIGFGSLYLIEDHFVFDHFSLFPATASDFLDWLVPYPSIQAQALLALGCLSVGVMGLLTAGGLWLLFRWPPLKWPVMAGFGFLVLTGLVTGFLTVVSVREAGAFRQWVQSDHALALKPGQGLVLKIVDPDRDERLNQEFRSPGLEKDGPFHLATGRADWSIEGIQGDSLVVTASASATGRTGRQAGTYASNIRHSLNLRDTLLLIDRRFIIPWKDGYHDQALDLKIGMPLGTLLYLDSDCLWELDEEAFTVEEPSEGWYRMTSLGLQPAVADSVSGKPAGTR